MIASFIIKISSLSKEELKKLEQYCHKSETRAGIVTEILLYSDEDLEVRSPCKNIQVFIHKDIAIAHRLAVAAASGEWLSFTTIRYLIRDKKQLLPKTAYNAPAKHVLLSNSSKVFFMVISKIYYADVINSIAQLKDILDNAEQKQYIHHIKPTVNDFLYEDKGLFLAANASARPSKIQFTTINGINNPNVAYNAGTYACITI
jgi:hypothetical protein